MTNEVSQHTKKDSMEMRAESSNASCQESHVAPWAGKACMIQSDYWKPYNSLQKQTFLLAHFTCGIIKTEKDFKLCVLV